jgi:uncharacterized protein (TIGR03000 family)
MNRARLGALALAAAVVLLLPSVSLAQRNRGGGGRWEGGNWSGRSWDGGWGGRTGFYYGYGSPYGLSFGYGRGYYLYSGYGYSPWWYGSGYSYPSYDYGYNYAPGYTTYEDPSYSYESAYPADASSGMMPDAGTRVMARVRVPTADAHLWIEGKEMNTDGLARRFVSPPLDAGQRYTYTFRAQWNENGKKMDQTREVRVHPGDRITVDFTAPEKSSGAGTRRESGYGPDETMPQGQEKVAPPQPRTNTPPATPQGEQKAVPSQPRTNTPPVPPERRPDEPRP